MDGRREDDIAVRDPPRLLLGPPGPHPGSPGTPPSGRPNPPSMEEHLATMHEKLRHEVTAGTAGGTKWPREVTKLGRIDEKRGVGQAWGGDSSLGR